jgi:c-di-GMP-binding flagellar brake protein YcgR
LKVGIASKRSARTNKERRTTHRYAVVLPVDFSVSGNQISQTSRGTTKNISTGGMYFTTEQEVAPNSQLDLRLTLPAQLVQGTDVVVLARSKVVRTEKKIEDGATLRGVAVSLETFDIIWPKP